MVCAGTKPEALNGYVYFSCLREILDQKGYFMKVRGKGMKITEKKEPVSTIPKGVWEASRPESDKEKGNRESTATTDLQGNGYPKSNGSSDSSNNSSNEKK